MSRREANPGLGYTNGLSTEGVLGKRIQEGLVGRETRTPRGKLFFVPERVPEMGTDGKPTGRLLPSGNLVLNPGAREEYGDDVRRYYDDLNGAIVLHTSATKWTPVPGYYYLGHRNMLVPMEHLIQRVLAVRDQMLSGNGVVEAQEAAQDDKVAVDNR